MGIKDIIKDKLNFKSRRIDPLPNEKDFDREQKITGGNSFEIEQELKAQDYINIHTIPERMKIIQNEYDKVKNQIEKDLVNRYSIQPYYLLQLQANYFCGTCKYECEDYKFVETMQQVIRCAFLYGQAGIYFDKGFYFPIWISRVKRDITGKIIEIEYGHIWDALEQQDGDTNSLTILTAKKKECDNIVIFKWGTLGLSAWIIVWPFVLFQAMLLKMTIIQSLFYNKKLIYKVSQQNRVGDEVRKFFDPLNIFIWVLAEDNLSNKFEFFEQSISQKGIEFLEYYKEVVAIYYHLFGRRLNNDVKKERNITSEVQASQENYEIVQSDWLIQFKNFIEALQEKVKPYGIQIKYVDREKEEQEKMKEQNNNEPNNKTKNV